MTLRLVADVHDQGTTIRLIGRVRAEHVEHLHAEIAASPPPTALDLDELTLADVEVVRFLVTLERKGVVLRHCAPFIREWMTREGPRIMSESVEQLRRSLLGDWVSIAPEVRPSATKSPDGTIKPFYLRRTFTYRAGDQFELAIVNSADPYGRIPLARIVLGGHMVWQGPHPIAAGAQRVDFIADDAYEVIPLAQPFVDILNRIAREGFSPWQLNEAQSVLGKTFVPFGLVAGKHFQECDLVYLRQDLLFWGARHVDGRGFESDANRPTNLQVPLVRGTAVVATRQ